MSLTPGTRLGVYDITAAIGAGGMGEVFRATDTKLKRQVAIKILPPSLGADADRLARFQREAEVLASLNHPNIAGIYGLEESGGVTALVMELVEGEDLSQRIAKGAIPLDEALLIATQIADALEAAHEQGIVHRDLKPANIKVRSDGQVKVLDFGLAKAIEPAASSSPSASMWPTITTPAMTQAGMILGTAAYMSPEQAKGRTVDRRADVWAFGAVFYEMLTGRRLFDAEDISETLAAVLTRDVSLTSLPAGFPLRLRALMRDCLIRDPKQRLRDIGDARLVLDRMIAGAPDDTVAPANTTAAVIGPSRIRERWAWAAATLILASVAAWLGVGMFTRTAVPNPFAHRLLLPLPDKVSLDSTPTAPLRLAVAPDGQRVAFIAFMTRAHAPTLWVQSLADSSAHEVKGTDGALGPVWSADSRRLSVLVGGALKAVDADTGTLTDLGPIGVGIWGPGTEMIGSTGNLGGWTVLHLSAPGATPSVLLKPSSPDEMFVATAILPDGQHFLVWHRVSRTSVRVEVASLSGGERPVLLDSPDLGNAKVASDALVYSRGDRLFAQPFDARRIRLSGQPTVIAERLDATTGFGAAFSVSANGVLVYAGGREDTTSRLTWVDRQGRMLSTLADDADYSNVELSPDGRRLAVSVTDPTKSARDIYLVDIDRDVRQRLTFDPSDERAAVWSPDGRQIVYNSKGLDLYRRSSDFTGTEEALQTDHASKDPRGISADGRLLLYRRSGASTSNDIWILPLDGGRKPEPVLETPFNENYAAFSPDARSIVYVSDESGQPELYVLSREGGGKVQLSTNGGTFPRWRRDGREILYLTPDQKLMSVAVSGSGRTFQAGATTSLFTMNVQPGAGTPFDVSADGQRFIVNTKIPSRLPPSLNVVVNWPALLPKP